MKTPSLSAASARPSQRTVRREHVHSASPGFAAAPAARASSALADRAEGAGDSGSPQDPNSFFHPSTQQDISSPSDRDLAVPPPPSPPLPRTNRTSLVPPLVLCGHAASLTRGPLTSCPKRVDVQRNKDTAS